MPRAPSHASQNFDVIWHFVVSFVLDGIINYLKIIEIHVQVGGLAFLDEFFYCF